MSQILVLASSMISIGRLPTYDSSRHRRFPSTANARCTLVNRHVQVGGRKVLQVAETQYESSRLSQRDTRIWLLFRKAPRPISAYIIIETRALDTPTLTRPLSVAQSASYRAGFGLAKCFVPSIWSITHTKPGWPACDPDSSLGLGDQGSRVGALEYLQFHLDVRP